MLISYPSPAFQFQGHRGARGLFPENTLPSFLAALDHGLSALELDVVLTGEHQFLVSHEPFFSHEFCCKPNGEPIQKEEILFHNIYNMTHETIKQYDCGRRGHVRYPEQQKIAMYKPLLQELLGEIENYVTLKQLKKPFYTIEIKSDMAWYGFMQPLPDEMVRLFLAELKSYPNYEDLKNRILVESFDTNILNELHKQHCEFPIGYLVENPYSIAENLTKLDFLPSVYVPYYRLLDEEKVAFLHKKGLQVFTWTVNDTKTMQKLLTWKIDSIITDFPNRVPKLMKAELSCN